MNECRTLWRRYELAMDCRDRAANPAEQCAWWAEGNEWLSRYFDAIDRQLEPDLARSTEGDAAVLKPAPMKLLYPQGKGARPL
jgi:hypothetical protein